MGHWKNVLQKTRSEGRDHFLVSLEFYNARRLFFNEIKQAKALCWKQFTEDLNESNVWPMRKALEGGTRTKSLPPIRNNEGELVFKEREKYKILASKFFPIVTEEDDNIIFVLYYH